MLLNGCAQVQPTVDYPLPKPVNPVEIKWYVITKETLSKKPKDVVFVGLTWEDSLKNRKWLEELKSFIEQQNIIICKHQVCNNE